MAVRVGINGFGRIGRLVLRSGFDLPDIEWVGINEISGDAAMSAHLLEFDSVHGSWERTISSESTHINIDGKTIGYSSYPTISEAPWKAWDCDIVIESTGKFRDISSLNSYFSAGVKKVIVAAPVKEGALNIVYGINHHEYKADQHSVLTAASCTTNCLAPVVKVIYETFGIKHGVITTIHDVTNTQRIADTGHKDLRRARSALNSLIPTSTGSATAITMIYPELKGKLNGVAVRVPLLNASLTDCVFEVERGTTVEEVNSALKSASEGPLKGILGYETRPLVSVDFVNDPRSGIIDAPSTMVVDQTQVKVLVWYDNEWGYANRMAELTSMVAGSLGDPG